MEKLTAFKLGKGQMNKIQGGWEGNAKCILKKDGIETPVEIYTSMTDEKALADRIANDNPDYEVVGCTIN